MILWWLLTAFLGGIAFIIMRTNWITLRIRRGRICSVNKWPRIIIYDTGGYCYVWGQWKCWYSDTSFNCWATFPGLMHSWNIISLTFIPGWGTTNLSMNALIHWVKVFANLVSHLFVTCIPFPSLSLCFHWFSPSFLILIRATLMNNGQNIQSFRSFLIVSTMGINLVLFNFTYSKI